MPEPIHVYFSQKQINFEEKTIEFAPEGIHRINPGLASGGGITLEVAVNKSMAEMLDRDLQKRIKAAEEGTASRPFIDFDHEGGRAAGIPKRIYWDNGIRLELEWTQAGKDAIEGRDYSYFSPELLLNLKTKEIKGLPMHGSIGSLVNAPAFQKIERLAAASSKQPKPNPKMEELEKVKAQLAAAEAKLVNSQEENTKLQAKLDEVTAERDDLKEKHDTLEASHTELKESAEKLQAAADKARKEKIEAAVKAKGIKEDDQEAIVTACLAADDDGEAILKAFQAPKSSGHDPLKKGEKKDKKADESSWDRLKAGIKANLEEQGLINA